MSRDTCERCPATSPGGAGDGNRTRTVSLEGLGLEAPSWLAAPSQADAVPSACLQHHIWRGKSGSWLPLGPLSQSSAPGADAVAALRDGGAAEVPRPCRAASQRAWLMSELALHPRWRRHGPRHATTLARSASPRWPPREERLTRQLLRDGGRSWASVTDSLPAQRGTGLGLVGNAEGDPEIVESPHVPMLSAATRSQPCSPGEGGTSYSGGRGPASEVLALSAGNPEGTQGRHAALGLDAWRLCGADRPATSVRRLARPACDARAARRNRAY